MPRRLVTRAALSVATSLSLIVAGLAISAGEVSADAPPVFPSCERHDSPGPDGTVHVQMNFATGKAQWGVTMTPSSKSIGQWSLTVLIGGKKSTSGFNRRTIAPYVPHGIVPESRPGLVMAVRGVVFSQDGNEYMVYGTPCRLPG